MKYFQSLPLVSVTKNNSTTIYRNIMSRLSIIPSILKNPLLYYTYDVQESDTPEIVADKYYGDSYRYWIVMLCNEMMDPQWDWPLKNNDLYNYIQNKYSDLGIDPYLETKSYKKIITQTNSVTNITTVNTVEISEEDYNSLSPVNTTLNTSDGQVHISITKNAQNYYDYEVEKNESKRTIKLINKDYVGQIESEFAKLMK